MAGGGGWESIVGDLDAEEPELERTPADAHPPRFDEPAAPPARPIHDLKTGTREPLAQLALVAAPIEPTPKKGLTLPKPGQAASTASGPTSAATAPPLAPIAEGFSGGLMERLGAESAPKPQTSFVQEYKELLSALGLALLLVVGFALYKGWATAEPEVLSPRPVSAAGPGKLPPPAPAPAPAPQPEPKPPAGAPPADGSATAEAPTPPPAQPIISVMTVPSDARVEINGLVRGQSPLVMKSPGGRSPVRVRIMKNRFKTWEELVQPNESGHFVVKVVLEAR